ncbi:kinase-like domain-containing protein [Crucibulum laeve]|uniref:Kinase-like domain-containing protein n=1 Tax=Crucibulum laeve TaxID=68775 RepID=A0A5C3M458_9AGAR|nr:kinase-like domain-containing protein [Crucibulum laeve]
MKEITLTSYGACRITPIPKSSIQDFKWRMEAWLKRQRSKGHGSAFMLNIYGVSFDATDPVLRMVSECPSSSLMEYLQQHPSDENFKAKSVQQIAAGLAHIHENVGDGWGLVHGDIRGDNIWVREGDGGVTCCIGPFCLEGRPKYDTRQTLARWIAPEIVSPGMLPTTMDNYHVYREGNFTKESDVFALGCTIIEIYTGSPPEPVRSAGATTSDMKSLRALNSTRSRTEQYLLPNWIAIIPSPAHSSESTVAVNLWKLLDNMLSFAPTDRDTSYAISNILHGDKLAANIPNRAPFGTAKSLQRQCSRKMEAELSEWAYSTGQKLVTTISTKLGRSQPGSPS